jgi:hypothetical protein
MANNIMRRLDAWREADRAAHEAAKQLLEQRLAFIQGSGRKPSEAEMDNVARLRAEAAALYKLAMDELEETAASTALVTPKR